MTKKRGPSPLDPSKLWLWGIHACKAALQNPERKCYRLLMTESTLKDLAVPKDSLSCKVDVLDSPSLSRLLPEGATHQGIAMHVAPLPERSLEEVFKAKEGILIVLDHVTDPQNVGAILRSAKALGALGVMLTERNAPPLGGALGKVASGALDLLPIWKVPNLARALEDLKKNGFWIIGLEEHASPVLTQADYPEKLALVVGAEGEGLRRLTRETCDFLSTLPTNPAFPTLNVSVATALALYELQRKA